MALHAALLIDRIQTEGSRQAKQQAQTLLFYFQTYHFIEYAQLVNDHLEAEDFAQFYIDSYSKRTDLIYTELNKAHDIPDEAEAQLKLGKTLRSTVFLNIVEETNTIDAKLKKYYLAHRNYLKSLTYETLIESRINWGLGDEVLQLDPKK
eukprot:TRINITY_DN9102_c0_g1_i7.p1 TRINITY_DN9102_c0_g1~~TRINITY_DN9102_c0_g1_i7.p1  ORF type:complete len:150 (-),score=31.02 TRINITY_DN9102_c0_g1_i7:15-464(-)